MDEKIILKEYLKSVINSLGEDKDKVNFDIMETKRHEGKLMILVDFHRHYNGINRILLLCEDEYKSFKRTYLMDKMLKNK